MEFEEAVASRYIEKYGDALEGGAGRQVWHTPTELFKVSYVVQPFLHIVLPTSAR